MTVFILFAFSVLTSFCCIEVVKEQMEDELEKLKEDQRTTLEEIGKGVKEVQSVLMGCSESLERGRR